MRMSDVKVCNCCNPECGVELIGLDCAAEIAAMPDFQRPFLAARLGVVAGHVNGRPVCERCLPKLRRKPVAAGSVQAWRDWAEVA